jgi:hypothetical protein
MMAAALMVQMMEETVIQTMDLCKTRIGYPLCLSSSIKKQCALWWRHVLWPTHPFAKTLKDRW